MPELKIVGEGDGTRPRVKGRTFEEFAEEIGRLLPHSSEKAARNQIHACFAGIIWKYGRARAYALMDALSVSRYGFKKYD